MEEKNITEQESLVIIQEMMNRTKEQFSLVTSTNLQEKELFSLDLNSPEPSEED